MSFPINAVPLDAVRLDDGLFRERFRLNREYVMSLKPERLLQNFYMESLLWGPRLEGTQRNRTHVRDDFADIHWGWESPSCQLRGHFLGHWLSAAARLYACDGDGEAKARADYVVSELARCQERNGGQWVFSIPPSYLDAIARGSRVWAPHYTIHKTLMGLVDAYRYAGNEQAIEILLPAADWFHHWTGQFSREHFDDILDIETGGMLEAWADLYEITGEKKHRDLIEKYTRHRLFDRLVAGEDVLTNRHVNTTIPEIHGAARVYEITGEAWWRKVVEAYWRLGVTEREAFCTGSHSSGEIWTRPDGFAARLGDTTQEHCVVYNMMRLADMLYRWTGEAEYHDYIERNLYNGVLAQQHPRTGMIAYFLPLEPGAVKSFGSPTHDFWCCHGSLVQAHTAHSAYAFYVNGSDISVCQFVPTTVKTSIDGSSVSVSQKTHGLYSTEALPPGDSIKTSYVSDPAMWNRPNAVTVVIEVRCEKPTEFTLSVRVPGWVAGEPTITVDGESLKSGGAAEAPRFVRIEREWTSNTVRLELPKSITISPIPDEPDTVAFLDGPQVLAALTTEQVALVGDRDNPDGMFTADDEREWWYWKSGYRTVGQNVTIRFKPLYEIADEPYTVYFPVAGR